MAMQAIVGSDFFFLNLKAIVHTQLSHNLQNGFWKKC